MTTFGQGNIPDDWEGDYCRYAICWPKSPKWEGVLRGVLVLPAKGRFWDAHTGNIIEAQNVIRETFDYNLNLRGVIMACEEPGLLNIAVALTKMANALASGSNCCDNHGSGGAPENSVPFSETVQGNPGIDEPPEGFETWEEFEIYKCAIAWNIVETLQTDVGRLAITNLANISLTGLAAVLAIAFVTPIPFANIVAIAGLLLTIAAEIVIATTLSIINDNEEELVCELYNGLSSANSRSLYLARFADFVASAVLEPVEAFAINSLMAYMLDAASTNRLYEKDLTRVWNERDCTDCTSGWTFSILPSEQESGVLVSGSMDADSELFVASAVLETGSDPCAGNYLLVVLSPTGGGIASITLASGGLTPSTCGVDWQWVETSTGSTWNTNNGTYEFDTFIDGRAFDYFAARSTVPFSLQFEPTLP